MAPWAHALANRPRGGLSILACSGALSPADAPEWTELIVLAGPEPPFHAVNPRTGEARPWTPRTASRPDGMLDAPHVFLYNQLIALPGTRYVQRHVEPQPRRSCPRGVAWRGPGP